MMSSTTAAAFSAAAHTVTVRVKGSGVESVNMDFEWTAATIIPPGFEKVCIQNGWAVESTWGMLNDGKSWLRASNEAYIYLNNADSQWWIDKPNGDGVFVAPKARGDDAPPTTGWRALSPSYKPEPSFEIIFHEKANNK
eukprot:CAMPEP_0168166500 /NCGR_PEP_ID=MMETSP0139_2-20121125/2059_1 /TAXON_ID=44445 /ORGANISM="Pseudo-nitzschia australis, Strain 10249 10 AB" /LENGTH=138 /DNA_ID=CAMNT_0008083699 /DNA_START=270 /DNA_END=686 /DNA_ORIENTATION=-